MERPPSQREAVVGLLHQRREARAREEGREAHGRPRGRPPPRRHVRHRRRGRRVRAQGEPAGDVAQDRRRRDRGETLVMIPIRDGRRLVIYGSGYLWTIGSINNPADGGRRRAPRGESKRTSRVTRAREQPPREVTRALMRRRPIDYAARAGSTSREERNARPTLEFSTYDKTDRAEGALFYRGAFVSSLVADRPAFSSNALSDARNDAASLSVSTAALSNTPNAEAPSAATTAATAAPPAAFIVANASRNDALDVTLGTPPSHASRARPPPSPRSSAATSDDAVASPTNAPSVGSTTTAQRPPRRPPSPEGSRAPPAAAASAASRTLASDDTLGASRRIASATRTEDNISAAASPSDHDRASPSPSPSPASASASAPPASNASSAKYKPSLPAVVGGGRSSIVASRGPPSSSSSVHVSLATQSSSSSTPGRVPRRATLPTGSF
eukprot:29188-Pelagococcus_subviridis.AAC.9